MKAFLEYWRHVPGYEGLYEVSDFGTVRSLNYRHSGKRKELKPGKGSNGYEHVSLYRDGVQKFFSVHRLVLEAFNGSIPEGLQIDHINGVKNDNRLANLRVVTPKDNSNNPVTRKMYLDGIAARENDKDWHAKRREAIKRRSENKEWRNNMREGVRRALAKPVLQLDKKMGEVIREWECITDVSRELGISAGNISACCRGERNQSGGFKWKFKQTIYYNF